MREPDRKELQELMALLYTEKQRVAFRKKLMERYRLQAADAEDVMQEGCYVIVNKILRGESFDGKVMQKMLWGVCHNLVLRLYDERKRHGITIPLDDYGDISYIDSQLARILDYAFDACDRDDRGKILKTVNRALNSLEGRNCKKLLTEKYVYGYRWEDVAEDNGYDGSDSGKSKGQKCRDEFRRLYISVKKKIIK